MKPLIRLLGSLRIAVPLLVAIAGVLAWGTVYETRFGTAAVQRFIYQSWWFQALLGFLAVNLAIAALERYPWKRKHLPFVLAHLGIILILVGGIIGGRFGIEGQIIIPEGQAERLLQLPQNVLLIRQPNPGITRVIPTNFEAQAWVHEPHKDFTVPLGDRVVRLTVDRYFPDAQLLEEVTDEGTEENPAVRLRMFHEVQHDDVWLFARDPERFGVRWGDAHLLFLEPTAPEQLDQLLRRSTTSEHPRGVVSVRVPNQAQAVEIPVPEQLHQPLTIEGTPYTITFKDYFPDFAISEQGLVSRSDEPKNPAVAFTLSGPEGTDAHLLFAFHPDFPALHGRAHTIHAQVRYLHAATSALPPNSFAILRTPSGALSAALTGATGERQSIEPLQVGTRYTHPWLGYQFEVAVYYPKAKHIQHMTNRSDEVRTEALHVIGREGEQTAEAWLGLRDSAALSLGVEPIIVEYRPAEQELPFSVKLLDFRKIDYPGTQMAAGFESDVELSDSQRGLILMRKISMNNPLKYRGFSLYQSSYVPEPVETTILSVRNDPGTPLVYTGFLIVILGVASMFILRAKTSGTTSEAL